MRGRGSEPKRKVLSWQPTSGTTRRADYLRRLLAALGSDADTTVLLDELWQDLDPNSHAGNGPWSWFRCDTISKIGPVRRLDHRKLRFARTSADDELFRCTRCRRLAGVSVRGICTTLRCDGRLEPWRPPAQTEERDHYRHLYLESQPVPMSVLEHTAQWTSEKAADIQAQFVR